MHKNALCLLLACCAAAHADDVEDRFLQMQHNMQQQNRRQESQTETPPAAAAGIAGELLQAINRADTEQLETLLARYRQSPDYDPDMELFARAAAAAAANDNAQAIALYRQLIERNPQFTRGKLDLARLLFIDKQNREARELFARIRLPEKPVIQQKINDYLAAAERREAWQGSFALGSAWSDNLNQSSRQSTVRSQWACDWDSNGIPVCGEQQITQTAPPPVSAHGIAYEAAANKKTALRGHHYLQLGGYAYGKLYRRAREFNEHHVSINPAYLYQNRVHSFSIGPLYRLSAAGTRLQTRRIGVQAAFNREFSQRLFAGIQAEHNREYYRNPDYRRFNGTHTAVYLNGAYAFTDRTLVFGGIDFSRKQSRDPADSYRRAGIRAGISHSFAAGIETVFQAAWRRSAYRAENAWLQTRRRDHETSAQLDFKFRHAEPGGWQPEINLKYTRNRSSSWVNDYRQTEAGIKIGYTF